MVTCFRNSDKEKRGVAGDGGLWIYAYVDFQLLSPTIFIYLFN